MICHQNNILSKTININPNSNTIANCTNRGEAYTNTATVQVEYDGGDACLSCRIMGHSDNPSADVTGNEMNVFPNPSNGKVTVAFDVLNANTSIEVYNIDGKLILKKSNLVQANKTLELDLSNEAKGVYLLKVLNGDNGILNKKILIE